MCAIAAAPRAMPPVAAAIALFVDGTRVLVNDCHVASNKSGVLDPFLAVSGLAPGDHSVRVENCPSPISAAPANIWIDGIGFSAP